MKSGNLSSLEKCCKLEKGFLKNQKYQWEKNNETLNPCCDHEDNGDCCSDIDHCDGLDSGHCNGHIEVEEVSHKHPCHKKNFDHNRRHSIKSMKSLSEVGRNPFLQSLDMDGLKSCNDECQSCIDDCDSCVLKLSFGDGRRIEDEEKNDEVFSLIG